MSKQNSSVVNRSQIPGDSMDAVGGAFPKPKLVSQDGAGGKHKVQSHQAIPNPQKVTRHGHKVAVPRAKGAQIT